MKKIASILLASLLILLSGSSAFSLEILPITPIEPIQILPISTLPSAPTGLGQPFMAHAGARLVNLVWSDNSTNETGFRIEAKTTAGTWIQKGTAASNATGFRLENLNPDISYTVRVIAYNSFGDSQPSNDYTFTTTPEITLVKPNGGSLAGGQTYTVQWEIEGEPTGLLGGDLAVQLYYNTDGSTYYPNIINHTSVMASDGSYSWIVPYLNTNSLKVMILFTQTGLGYSATISDTNDSNIKVSSPPLAFTPIKPSNLSGRALSSSEIELIWDHSDELKSGFKIYRKTGVGEYTVIKTVEKNTYTFVDSNLSPNTTYSYKIVAYTLLGDSGDSNVMSVKTPSLGFLPIIPELIVPILPITIPDEEVDEQYPSASDWAKTEIAKAYQYGLTTDHILSNFTQAITREEFCEIVIKLYEESSGEVAVPVSQNPFKDTTNPEILKAYRLGIVYGTSVDTFEPNKNITRQEICVMLLREQKTERPGGDYSVSGIGPFADDHLIATWAKEAVQYMNRETIMNGIGGNKIDPLGNTTREQAIALVLRTYERF